MDRPPVFRATHADLNILCPSHPAHALVVDEIPRSRRHRWFGSMRSSQALAQSLFGYIKSLNRLAVLADVRDDDGLPVFFGANEVPGRDGVYLEHDVRTLREPRPTSLDVLFRCGQRSVAVECKLAEDDIGSCSRPRLRPRDSTYASQHCNGYFELQRGRKTPCSLSELGIAYWEHISDAFRWSVTGGGECQLRYPYQLVRNVLAACVGDDGRFDPSRGHAVLVYDERNPAFTGAGRAAGRWERLRSDLRDSSLLRRCSWQRIIRSMARDDALTWLVGELAQKYGLSP